MKHSFKSLAYEKPVIILSGVWLAVIMIEDDLGVFVTSHSKHNTQCIKAANEVQFVLRMIFKVIF